MRWDTAAQFSSPRNLAVGQQRHNGGKSVHLRSPAYRLACHDLVVITKAEYAAKAAAQDDWAPGWLAIDASFESLYPGVKPRHLGSPAGARAIFGGEEHLDGISLFPSPNGYQHLLTYGMSGLYADEEAYGGDFSGWGYEMTMKVGATGPDDCWWAVGSLRNLARYTWTSRRWLEPYQYITRMPRLRPCMTRRVHAGRAAMVKQMAVTSLKRFPGRSFISAASSSARISARS